MTITSFSEYEARYATTPWGLHRVSLTHYLSLLPRGPVIFVRTHTEVEALLDSVDVDESRSARSIPGTDLTGGAAEIWVLYPWPVALDCALPDVSLLTEVNDTVDVDALAWAIHRRFDFIADAHKALVRDTQTLALRNALQLQGQCAVQGIREGTGRLGRDPSWRPPVHALPDVQP